MARSARGSPGGAPELHRADRRRVGGEAEDGLSTPVAGDRCQVSPSRTRGEVRSIVIARADLGSTLSPRRSARLPDVSTDREIGAAGSCRVEGRADRVPGAARGTGWRRHLALRPLSGHRGAMERQRSSRVVRSAFRATLGSVAPTPPPLSLRLGREGMGALDEIARRRGVTRSEAARQAIAETAERDRRRGGLAAEAARLLQDPAYQREALEVAALMEELRGPR